MNDNQQALLCAEELEWQTHWTDHAAALRRLVAENEALRADAERYRYIRDEYMTIKQHKQVLSAVAICSGEELDNAIDAMRSKE